MIRDNFFSQAKAGKSWRYAEINPTRKLCEARSPRNKFFPQKEKNSYYHFGESVSNMRSLQFLIWSSGAEAHINNQIDTQTGMSNETGRFVAENSFY